VCIFTCRYTLLSWRWVLRKYVYLTYCTFVLEVLYFYSVLSSGMLLVLFPLLFIVIKTWTDKRYPQRIFLTLFRTVLLSRCHIPFTTATLFPVFFFSSELSNQELRERYLRIQYRKYSFCEQPKSKAQPELDTRLCMGNCHSAVRFTSESKPRG